MVPCLARCFKRPVEEACQPRRFPLTFSEFLRCACRERDELEDDARRRLDTNRCLMIQKVADTKRVVRVIDVGDLVMLWDKSRPSLNKVSRRFWGPYKVTKSYYGKSFKLLHIVSPRIIKGRFPLEHLKLFHKRMPHLRNPGEREDPVGPLNIRGSYSMDWKSSPKQSNQVRRIFLEEHGTTDALL